MLRCVFGRPVQPAQCSCNGIVQPAPKPSFFRPRSLARTLPSNAPHVLSALWIVSHISRVGSDESSTQRRHRTHPRASLFHSRPSVPGIHAVSRFRGSEAGAFSATRRAASTSERIDQPETSFIAKDLSSPALYFAPTKSERTPKTRLIQEAWLIVLTEHQPLPSFTLGNKKTRISKGDGSFRDSKIYQRQTFPTTLGTIPIASTMYGWVPLENSSQTMSSHSDAPWQS